MSNIADVIDFLDNLTDEVLEETITAFKGDIIKAQTRIDALEAIRRGRQTVVAPEAPVELPAAAVLPLEGASPPETKKEGWGSGYYRPAPAKSPERAARLDDERERIYSFLEANGPATVVKISRNISIHHRRVAKLLETHPAQFSMHKNGEWEILCH